MLSLNRIDDRTWSIFPCSATDNEGKNADLFFTEGAYAFLLNVLSDRLLSLCVGLQEGLNWLEENLRKD